MHKLLVFWLTVMWVMALASPVRAEKKRIAVADLRADAALEKGTARTLNEVLLVEFQRSGLFEVIAGSDISSLLKLEEQKAMLGCSDDACLAEIGGALGVELLITPSLGAVGEQYVINIKVLDVAKVKVLVRTSEFVSRDDTEIVAGIQQAVKQVIDQLTSGEQLPEARNESGVSVYAPWVTLGLTVAAAGVAGTMGALALSDAEAARADYLGSPTYQDHRDAAETKGLVADVMIGVAGAAALTTLILFLVADGDEDEQAVTSLGAAPVAGGVGAWAVVRF